jgi:photosystem II stability/assembly factor-like uncharacterized protein
LPILLCAVLALCLPLVAQSAGALEILAWTTYTDMDREYANSVDAIQQYRPDALFTEFTGATAAELEAALAGKDAFLVPEPEDAVSSQLRAAGSDWAGVLEAFAMAGGSVVVCGEYSTRWGFLDATGLLEYDYETHYTGGHSFRILKRGHRLVRYVPDPELVAVNATMTYSLTSGVALAVDGAGQTMLASRKLGNGWAVLVGYDYYDYDDNAAQVLANAVSGPDDHWTWEAAGELDGAVKAYCLCETDDGIYAGTGPVGNVFFTSDGGQNWTNTANLQDAVHVFSLLSASDGSLLAGTLCQTGGESEGRVFRSLNGGQTWQSIALPGSNAVFCLAETPTGVVIAGTSPGGELFMSMDGGGFWTGPLALPGAESVDALLALADGDLFAGAGPSGDIFRSTDAGLNWEATADLAGVEHVYTLTLDGAGGIIAGTAPLGCLWRSADQGAHWSQIGCMAGTDFISDLLTDTDGRIYATTAPNGDVYRSEDGGKTWRPTPNLNGAGQAFCLHHGSDGRLYVGTGLNGDVFVSGGEPTMQCYLNCTPSSGTLPFASRFTVTLVNPGDGYRVAAGRIDVTTAGGTRVTNWRAGFTILAGGEVYENSWMQPFPATGGVLGHNWFDLQAVDVTPVPYNQPPHMPSGDEDADCATIRGMAP